MGNWCLEKGRDLLKVTQQVTNRIKASDLSGLHASTQARTPYLFIFVV